jgi:hypothetical protein
MRTTTIEEDKQFLKAMFPDNLLEEAIDFIREKFSPSEIYDAEALSDWALDNGFVTAERESILMDEISDLEAENEVLQNELNEYNE